MSLPPRVETRGRATRMLRYAPLLPLLAFGIAVSVEDAQAQIIEQYFPDDLPGYVPDFSNSVLNRMYYQQDPAGIEIGDTIIRPALSETTGYNSNTLGAAGSGSSALESNARLRVDSDWSRNFLSLSFSADNRRYFEVPAASYTNYEAGAAGYLDLGNDRLKFSYAHSALNIASTDLGVVGITTPVAYAIDDAKTAFVKSLGRCSLTASGEFENFAFGRSNGDADIDYSSLNHRAEIESLAGRYQATPGNAAILLVRLAQTQFPTAAEDTYKDEAGFVGLDFRGDAILQLRALLGFERRNFSAGNEKPISLPSFELSALWAPTQLDTIIATATRRIDDPTSPFALDATILDGKLALYHELRSHIFLTGSFEIQKGRPEFGNAYLNSANQTQANLALGVTWDISPHITGTLGYAYSDTASQHHATTQAATGQYPNFNSHTILIGITLYE